MKYHDLKTLILLFIKMFYQYWELYVRQANLLPTRTCSTWRSRPYKRDPDPWRRIRQDPWWSDRRWRAALGSDQCDRAPRNPLLIIITFSISLRIRQNFEIFMWFVLGLFWFDIWSERRWNFVYKRTLLTPLKLWRAVFCSYPKIKLMFLL